MDSNVTILDALVLIFLLSIYAALDYLATRAKHIIKQFINERF